MMFFAQSVFEVTHCKSICNVPPSSFHPPPKVQSEVIALEPFRPEDRLELGLARTVENLITSAFLSRRKMLKNTLSNLCQLSVLERLAHDAGISLKQRPQEISPDAWIVMARGLNFVKQINDRP